MAGLYIELELEVRHEAIMLKILPIILFRNSQNVYPLFSGFSPIIPGKKVIIQHNNNIMQTLYQLPLQLLHQNPIPHNQIE